ncbi:MAG: acyl-CoA/acyl-ACP dehydrogenase [Planctomycetota bacterium]|nr:acyl-CoA/acyl-ACP dehydrogenase [Planctomycetota bacterium]
MYGLDETGREWAARARVLADTVAGPNAADTDEAARFPAVAIRSLQEQGFMGLCLSTETNGHGQSPRVFAVVVEELAQACASTAMIYVMHVCAAQAIAESTESDQSTLLREIAAGTHLTTLAFSERGSRSEFWAPVSKLESGENGGFVTSAIKSWVTAANHADSYVSTAQALGAESPLESVLYVVRRGTAGVAVSGAFTGLGLRGNDSAPITFEGVAIDDEHLLTEQKGGAAMILEVVLPWFAIGTAAMANGLCRAVVSATSGHLAAAGYEQEGRKLRDLPNLRARLAEMSVTTEQSCALLGYTVSALERPDEMTPLYVLQARLAAIEAAQHVTDLAMQACGGAAFSKHLPIERLFRDARAGCVMAPTADHLRDFVGRALTGLPLF